MVHVISVWVMSVFTWWVSSDPSHIRAPSPAGNNRGFGQLLGLAACSWHDPCAVCICKAAWLSAADPGKKTHQSTASTTAIPSAAHHPCRLFGSQLLWTYAKKSVALRVRYFTTLPKGVASHTALVQDIPGVPFGTQAQRVESVAPKAIASKARLGR